MQLTLDYPLAVHHEASATEIRAAEQGHKRVNRQREAALLHLASLGSDGLTHRELDEMAGWPAVTGSRRLYDLHQLGVVVRTTRERRRCNVYLLNRFWTPDMGRIAPRRKRA